MRPAALIFAAMVCSAMSVTAHAASSVPVRENTSVPVGPRCPLSNVFGLKADGDGFLSVRSGPGSNYRELARLPNGDLVFVVEDRGAWYGVYYGVKEAACNSASAGAAGRPKQGWVSRKWIEAD